MCSEQRLLSGGAGRLAGSKERGGRHQDAKLTDAIVMECRARRAAGETMASLAREFGVSFVAMRNAIIGVTWKHVP
jgi:hypothetical protein